MLTAISLYSGADNLGDGVIQAGHKIVLAIDNNADACETIKLNHPDVEVICGNVSDYLKSLPKCDAVIGGPPCQGFSIANKTRNYDLREVKNFKKARKITKCKYYFMENVRGITKVLNDDNYLINCADYGVPQTRIRRIFTNLSLPKPTHSKNKWITMKKALGIKDITTTKERLWFGSHPKFSNISYKQRAYFHELNKPARTITTKDLGIQASMMISDGTYCRKLITTELAILQGFRKNYKFYGGKTSIRKQIGNALPAVISKAFFQQY